MNFIIIATGVYGSILLGVGDLAMVVVSFIAGIYGYICQSGRISSYKKVVSP